MDIGIQLFSVSDAYKDNEAYTLKALSEMGYSGVEFAFEFGRTPVEELAGLLENTGLTAVGIYSKGIKNLADPEDELYKHAKTLKMRHVTVGSESLLENWQEAVSDVNRAGIAAGAKGLQLLYHNHAGEIRPIGDKPALSILAEQTDPEYVQMELDTHFIAKAGDNPIEWIEKYSGRLPALHIKDIHPDGGVAEIGEGILDMPAICRTARTAGVKWLIVEFHNINGKTPLESASLSLKNLRKII